MTITTAAQMAYSAFVTQRHLSGSPIAWAAYDKLSEDSKDAWCAVARELAPSLAIESSVDTDERTEALEDEREEL